VAAPGDALEDWQILTNVAPSLGLPLTYQSSNDVRRALAAGPPGAADPDGLGARVQARRLHRRALDLPASDVPGETQAWLSDDPALLAEVEDALARELGLAPGELLLDFPARASMLGVDLPLLTRSGTVERLTDAGRAGQLGLPRVADELYRSARRLRVFVAEKPRTPLRGVPSLLTIPAAELRGRLDEQSPLLQRSAVR
jgi:hypothetical protein